MGQGYQVDPAQLRQAARDIGGYADKGRGIEVANVASGGIDTGHAGLHAAVERFCYTWQLAVTGMVQRLEQHQQALTGAAARYEGSDQHVVSQLGRLHGPVLP